MAAAPPLRDRGHRTGGRRGRAATASSSRAVDFHRAEDRRNSGRAEGNSTGTDSRRARREVRGGEREGREPTGPFRAPPQRKLTVAATATAADRNLSPAPAEECAGAEGGVRRPGRAWWPPEGGETHHGTASTRALLPAAATRAAGTEHRAGPAGRREGGDEAAARWGPAEGKGICRT